MTCTRATTLGVASALASLRKDLPGEVMMIFQPAEEGAPAGEKGGAGLMVKEGMFKDFKPDAIFGMHVTSSYHVGTVALRPGGIMASSDTLRMVVHGRQTHGATPWRGIDPIVTGADIVMSAQSIVSRRMDINKDPVVLTFGIFDGGQRFNIVPDSASLEGTLRAFDTGMRDQALAELRQLAEHVAAAHGATRRSRGSGRVGEQPGQLQRSGADRPGPDAVSRRCSARNPCSKPNAGPHRRISRCSATACRHRASTSSSAARRRTRTPIRWPSIIRRDSLSMRGR